MVLNSFLYFICSNGALLTHSFVANLVCYLLIIFNRVTSTSYCHNKLKSKKKKQSSEFGSHVNRWENRGIYLKMDSGGWPISAPFRKPAIVDW